MINARFVEAVDYNIIKIENRWTIEKKSDHHAVTGDHYKIMGIPVVDGIDRDVIKKRISTILEGKNIALVNLEVCKLSDKPDDIVLGGGVYVDDTNLLYYFPDYTTPDTAGCTG